MFRKLQLEIEICINIMRYGIAIYSERQIEKKILDGLIKRAIESRNR